MNKKLYVHNGQSDGKDSSQQLHSCCFLDLYRPFLAKEAGSVWDE